jgi:hypothetical protein
MQMNIHLSSLSGDRVQMRAYLWNRGDVVASMGIAEHPSVVMAAIGHFELTRAIETYRTLRPGLQVQLRIDTDTRRDLDRTLAGVATIEAALARMQEGS